MHAFSGGRGEDVNAPLERLGKQFFLEQPGVTIKKYPCCGSTHTRSTPTSPFARSSGSTTATSIRWRSSSTSTRRARSSTPILTRRWRASSRSNTAWLPRWWTTKWVWRSSTTRQVMRPEIRALMPKIKMKRNPGQEGKPSWVEAYNEVRIKLKNGKVLSKGQHRDYEGPVVGVTPEGMDMKFRDCASLALPKAKVNEALEILHSLEKQPQHRAAS